METNGHVPKTAVSRNTITIGFLLHCSINFLYKNPLYYVVLCLKWSMGNTRICAAKQMLNKFVEFVMKNILGIGNWVQTNLWGAMCPTPSRVTPKDILVLS